MVSESPVENTLDDIRGEEPVTLRTPELGSVKIPLGDDYRGILLRENGIMLILSANLVGGHVVDDAL